MEPARSGEAVLAGEEGGGGRSSASDHSSLSPVSGFSSPDGLGAPEDYCRQVRAGVRKRECERQVLLGYTKRE